MAALHSAVIMDTPHYKIFEITVPEVDAAGAATETVMTFGGGGMQNFRGAPQVWWAINHTPATDNPTVTVKIGIHTVTALGFTVCKTSVTAATAVLQTFRVFMTDKRLGEI